MSHKLTTEEFVRRSNEVHKCKYGYLNVSYINNQTKIKITCPVHGIFLQRPDSHLWGKGCWSCSNTKRLTTDLFILEAKKVHKNKYDYSKTNYTTAHHKVKIKCPTHGEFLQKAYSHLQGRGCKKCGGTCKSSTENFVKNSNLVHKNKYDYSLVDYSNNRNKVKIICRKHGTFFQKPNYHLLGEGCPKCAKRISKPEVEFLNFFNIPDEKSARQVCIMNKQVDGFIDRTNTIYEFLGDYWHGNPQKYNCDDINPACKKSYGELYENTIKKFELLKNCGYNVRYVWESDWKKFKRGIDKTPHILEF